MTDRPSEDIQNTVAKVIAEAMQEAVDWDFTEKLIAPTLEYVKRCLRENMESGVSPFYFSGQDYKRGEDGRFVGTDKPDGLTIGFEICDEDAPLVSQEDMNLADLLSRQYDSCFQSQADVVWGLERTLERVKQRYVECFGFECTKDAVAAERERRWPGKSTKSRNIPEPAGETGAKH